MELQNFVNLHVSQIETAIASPAASALVASWRRSIASHKLDPAEFRPPRRITDAQLKEAQQSLEPLMRVADSILDRLFQGVGGAGCCVLLADANGVPIARRGAPADDKAFHRWGLWPGTVWSEESEGTNGIGTCLVEQRPQRILRTQHFLARNTLMSCIAAPIFDHHGKLVAALDVSSCRADLAEESVPLISMAVSDAARRIEGENFRTSFPRARITIAPVADHHTSAALIAVDNDDIVIGANRSARLQLGITQATIDKGLPAGMLIKGLTHAVDDGVAIDAFAEAERGVLCRALAETDGNVTAAAERLGISRATLHRKMKKMGLERHR
jgi:transcriptional regulator of acetoin/glycerol metabolism